MNSEKLIQSLNKMLAQEHACAIRYATHASLITGPYAETIAARLKEIAQDEILHAEKLRERIVGLGGIPTMDVSRDDLKIAHSLDEILSINIEEETQAILLYTRILESVPQSNVILYQVIQEVLRDEQEHLEELEHLEKTK